MTVQQSLKVIVAPVVIVAMFLLLGFKIRDWSEEARLDNNRMYETAIPARDKESYDYVLKTQQGIFYTESLVVAKDPVSVPAIKGEYTSIYIKEEHYVMKTRVVTTTDDDGNVETHIETYWEWDVYSRETINATTLIIHGIEYPFNKFKGIDEDYITRLKPQSDVRITYYGSPVEDTYMFMASANEAGMQTIGGKDNGIALEKRNFDTYIEEHISDGVFGKWFFWIFWIILTGASVFGYFYLMEENGYL